MECIYDSQKNIEGEREYLVKWEGLDPDQSTWEKVGVSGEKKEMKTAIAMARERGFASCDGGSERESEPSSRLPHGSVCQEWVLEPLTGFDDAKEWFQAQQSPPRERKRRRSDFKVAGAACDISQSLRGGKGAC